MYGRPADYRKLNIESKPIYVFKDHATAILAWYNEKRDTPLNLITFDDHTDTFYPLKGYTRSCLDSNQDKLVAELDKIKANLSSNILKKLLIYGEYLKAPATPPPCAVVGYLLALRYDEHISTALYLDILSKAYICCHKSDGQIRELTNSALRKLYEERIYYLSKAYNEWYPPNATSIEELVCELNSRKNRNISDLKISQLINTGLDITKPYILDIDLDYFHDLSVLEQPYETYRAFSKLCNNAACITIATEPGCVRDSCEIFNSSVSDYNRYLNDNPEIGNKFKRKRGRKWEAHEVLEKLLTIIEYSLTRSRFE